MPILGITGGIASGKTTVSGHLVRLLEKRGATPVHFCADRQVSELLEHSPEVHAELKALFGPEVITPEGRVNRSRIREQVFGEAGRERRRQLEAILHPKVREAWQRLAVEARGTGRWLLLDIPLLYETGGEKACDAVLVVACSRETQLRRLERERGLSRTMAEAIVAAQAPLAEKVLKADMVVWSDCSFPVLEKQVSLLVGLWDRNGALGKEGKEKSR